ncbi:hypothetical protein [Nocardia sp. NPDC051570]|uniref:hypothetical protein n=1 Tax=Nocardia sp. NPDC051570 TaxID=3364324 RepID=UPI0037A6B573
MNVEQATSPRRLSFAGTVTAPPDFATTSAEVLRRELGDSNTAVTGRPAGRG